MARHTDGRPEEEFLTRAHEREARADAGDIEDEPTVDILVDDEDLREGRGIVPPEHDERVPPWWHLQRHNTSSARGMVLAVLLVLALSVLLIGIWTATTGSLPPYEDMQPSPQALPGQEDVGQPGRESQF